jgi:signal transduction histidine kinase
MPDDDNSVWLLTACGLVRIARSELDGWAADPARRVKIAVFDISDGVESHSYASSYVSQVTKSPDGRIWFVPRDGVSVIDPHHLAFNKLAPPVHIEKIVADDKTYDEPGNGVRLATGVRYLTIDYTALSLVAPEKVHFRYKLEGQDKDWREVVNDREVQYSNLAPKRYRFRVLASNNSGVWNEEGAAVEFVIPPAWYQTNWFRAACVAAFLAMMWGVYELRVRQLAAEFNVRLEERVAERTRIARDLHDTLLQSFQGLLPLFQVGIKKLPEGAVDSRKTLQLALDRASEAIGEGRDAIKGLRMSTTEKNDLAMAIRTIGEEFAAGEDGQNSISFQLLVEGTPRELHPILRDEIYRLATEALRNSFRHADAKNVEVEIRYDEKYFRLRVRDDGKGIPSDVLSRDGREGHYGLPGMRERAKRVGGKLTIWTELDSGTEVELVIPGARAYVKSARPFWYFGKRSSAETSAERDEKETIERE